MRVIGSGLEAAFEVRLGVQHTGRALERVPRPAGGGAGGERDQLEAGQRQRPLHRRAGLPAHGRALAGRKRGIEPDEQLVRSGGAARRRPVLQRLRRTQPAATPSGVLASYIGVRRPERIRTSHIRPLDALGEPDRGNPHICRIAAATSRPHAEVNGEMPQEALYARGAGGAAGSACHRPRLRCRTRSQAGETLWSIAAANNFTTRALAAANGLPEDAPVVLGSTIQIPSEQEAAQALGTRLRRRRRPRPAGARRLHGQARRHAVRASPQPAASRSARSRG